MCFSFVPKASGKIQLISQSSSTVMQFIFSNWLHALHTAYKTYSSHTHAHTGRSSFPITKNQTHPPESLGSLHPGGFPMKAQRCPQLMFEHHCETACGSGRASRCLLCLPLACPSDATAAPRAPLSDLTARQPFPFMKQLPHPEPLHCVFPSNCMQTKTTPSPPVSKPCCNAHTLTSPNGGQR